MPYTNRVVFHASLAGRELPAWSRCMAPALLTSSLHAAFLFYILIPTVMTNCGKKSALSGYLGALGFPQQVQACTPAQCSHLCQSTPPSADIIPGTNHSSHHPGCRGRPMDCTSEKRQKMNGRLCLFCLAGGSPTSKASNEDNDE